MNAIFRSQRLKVAVSIGSESDGFAIKQGGFDKQRLHRLRDLLKLFCEVGPMPSPQDNAASVLTGKEPVAMMFDFVHPLGTARRLLDLSRLSGDVVNEYSFRQEYCPLEEPGSLFSVASAGGLGWGFWPGDGLRGA
jgi:hypothetical protein